MTYQLQATDKTADESTRPLTANLSIITYDAANKKQVINEYLVYKEYINTAHMDKSLLGSIWDMNTMSESPVFHLPPFGIDLAIMRASDLIIPEGCTWLFNKKVGDLLGTSITDNIGKPERQVVVTQRWIPGSGLKTREVTIIQSGTVDKTILSPTHEIVLNNDLVTQGKIKFDETLSTIIIAGSGLTADDVIFNIRGIAASASGTPEPIKPIIVQFGENCDWWSKPLSGSLYLLESSWGHEYKIPFPVYPSSKAGPRETEFTVTTYNGKPIEKTYRLIQLGRNTSTVN